MKRTPLSILFFTVFLDLVGFGLVIPVLPIYAEDLGAAALTIGLIEASFSAAQFYFAPFWGALSDRIGRRPVLLISIAVMMVSYLILANASTLLLLFLARSVAGIGAANVSIANAYVSDISPVHKRAKNFGIIGAAMGLGFIFGPPLGGMLKDFYGMDGVGYAAAGLSLLNLVLAWLLLPESSSERNTKRKLFTTPLREFRSVFPRVTLRSLLLTHLIFMGAFSMLQMTASLLWKNRYMLREVEIGYTFGFIGICIVIIQGLLLGRLSAVVGERNLFVAGNFMMAIGLISMPYVPVEVFVPIGLIGLVFIAFGSAFFTPTISSLLTQSAGDDEQGKVLGLMQAMGSLGRVAGPITGGFFYGIAYYLPFTVAAGIMLITGSMALWIVRVRLYSPS